MFALCFCGRCVAGLVPARCVWVCWFVVSLLGELIFWCVLLLMWWFGIRVWVVLYVTYAWLFELNCWCSLVGFVFVACVVGLIAGETCLHRFRGRLWGVVLVCICGGLALVGGFVLFWLFVFEFGFG